MHSTFLIHTVNKHVCQQIQKISSFFCTPVWSSLSSLPPFTTTNSYCVVFLRVHFPDDSGSLLFTSRLRPCSPIQNHCTQGLKVGWSLIPAVWARVDTHPWPLCSCKEDKQLFTPTRTTTISYAQFFLDCGRRTDNKRMRAFCWGLGEMARLQVLWIIKTCITITKIYSHLHCRKHRSDLKSISWN